MNEITTDQTLPITVSFDGGNFDNAPIWTLSDDGLGSLNVAGDGLSAVFTPTNPGTEYVYLTGTVQSGSINVVGALTITIIAPPSPPTTLVATLSPGVPT